MATQQKKRKVKQYPEHPDYKFIVVGNPWPATKHGRDRDFKFYCTVTAWLEFMLGQKDLVQSIYSINTVHFSTTIVLKKCLLTLTRLYSETTSLLQFLRIPIFCLS